MSNLNNNNLTKLNVDGLTENQLLEIEQQIKQFQTKNTERIIG